MHSPESPICYLAPELTASESTYVYEELLAIERHGYKVIPVSVRKPMGPVTDITELVVRTQSLYEKNSILTLYHSLIAFSSIKGERAKGFHLVWSDMLELGFFDIQSWKLLYQYFVAMRLVEILAQNNCQHLHVHFAHVPSQIGMYASAISGIPFTIMAHANDIFERGLLLKRKAERAVKMLTISEHNLKFLTKLNIPKDKLAIVRCGVSFESQLNIASKKQKDIYRLGTLGRLVEKKGIDVLLKAISLLADKSYTIELSIAGDGPLLDDLQQQVKSLGLSDLVTFVGSLTHTQVATWMQSLDIFVLACKKDSNGDMDGIPVVLMEAMSQRVPVISTWLSGIPELVIHQHTGLLAEPNDHDDLAIQIERLCGSPSDCESFSENAIVHVQSEFGQQVNINRLLKQFGYL